jgi:hypothetical protein
MNCLSQVFQLNHLTLAVSTGTPGPFQKSTIMIMDSEGKVLGFAKIGELLLAKERLKREALMLENLKSSRFLDVLIPSLLYAGDLGNAYILLQSPVPFVGRPGQIALNSSYVSIVKSLVQSSSTQTLESSAFFKKILDGLEHHPVTHLELIKKAYEHFFSNYASHATAFGVMHGDFTPWNILWDGKRAFLYDWELGSMNAPAGIDLIHFLFQTGLLLKKLRRDKLLTYIRKGLLCSLLLNDLREKILADAPLISAYCLYMAVSEDREDLWGTASFERRWILTKMMKADV